MTKAKTIGLSINELIAGILSGLIIVIIATAFTALIFKDYLSGYFSIGISCALIGSCIANTFIVSLSSFRFAIGRAEPAVAAVLAIIFANMANAQISEASLLPTLLITFALVCFLAGASTFLLGYFKLGQTVRFLPYPVLGGVVTGTAWIMATSSFLLMANSKLINFSNFHFEIQATIQYSLGVSFALLLLFLQKNYARPWILPVLILLTSVIINVVLEIKHISHHDAVQSGWLFSSFKPIFVMQSINLSMMNQISWITIADQLGYILSLVGVIIILVLLSVGSIEAITKEKADLEQELKVTGIANIISGGLMGVPANMSLSGSLLNLNMGATRRISGFIATIVCLIVLFVYPDMISYLPKPIIGGLILYFSLMLLTEWLYEGWKRLPSVDYFIVLSILVTVALKGFLSGVIAGVVITCIVFIIRYARINAIKYETAGETYHSNVIRPLSFQEWLMKEGKKIRILKLQGYLFFGSAKLLLDHVSKQIEQEKDRILFLIFDFQAVNGVDSSAAFNFIRLQQVIDKEKLKILFTGCSENIIEQFKRQGVFSDSDIVISFATLDQGLEWCEDELLKSIPNELRIASSTITNTLHQLIPDEKQQKIFVNYLEKIELPANEILIKQGELIDCIYFIESGEVAVFLENKDTSIRVSKSGPGTIIGEISFYLHTARIATVRTETHCVIYKITGQSMQEIEKTYPEIALTFHKSVIHVLASRVIQTNYELTLELS